MSARASGAPKPRPQALRKPDFLEPPSDLGTGRYTEKARDQVRANIIVFARRLWRRADDLAAGRGSDELTGSDVDDA